MLPTSSWTSNEGGEFGDAANWIPQQPTSGTANISLPSSFELNASGVLPIDKLLIGPSRPVLTGSGVAFGSVGSGLLQVQGTRSYTGSLTIAEPLSVTGRVSVGGEGSPGILKLSPDGSLLVSENLEIARSGELQVILTNEGDVPIQVQGTAILDGTLSGVLPSSAQPAIGDSWTIMEIGVMDGDSKFPVVVLPGLGVDRYLSVHYVEGIRGNATIVLTVESLADFFDWGDPSGDVVNGRAVDIVVADFGSAAGGPDGYDDIALAIPGTPGRVLFLVSDGLGGISEQVSWTVCDNPVGLAAGDFDGDSRLDVAFVSTSQNIVQTLLNSGSNISEMVLSSGTPTASGPVDAAVLQLGGDDEDDLVVACAGDGTVQVDGSLFGELQIFEHATGFVGDFMELTSVAVNGKPGQVKPGSVGSGKGGRRVASTLLGLNELVVIGESGGVWSEQQRISVGSEPYDLVMNDLDGDGFDDVLVGNSGSSTVSVLLGQGDGTLGEQQVFEAGQSPQNLTLLDYDGDGDHDLAFRSYNDAEESVVTLLSNDTASGTGSIAWGEDWIIQEGSAVSLVASGYLNGNKTADLVTVLGPMGLRGEQSPVRIRSAVVVAPCEGDVDGDQVVDVNDILLVVGGWGTPDGDVNGDGDTTIDDLLLCISRFGPCM
ncbi:MAG: VCBS repeat-containing protein [Phycisphaerae bacterium]|nr:VCBS repeat-containing protein [Phycisphaerae bacterium]